MKKIMLLLIAVMLLGGCFLMDDADVASHNLSKAADQFNIVRRIVFYNGITDTYMLTIEGRSSIEVDTVDNQLEVVVKVGEGRFLKHFLGLSDNVTYFAEQIDEANVSVYHYKVIFKPKAIIPDIDLVN